MGRAPIIKNGIRIFIMINAKGAAPIAKNVIVVDENGNQYEATYPKRARNLVKNGRARYIDDNKICLACPPSIELEEDEMSKTGYTKKQVIEMITSLKDILNSYSVTVISAINYVEESQQCMEEDVKNIIFCLENKVIDTPSSSLQYLDNDVYVENRLIEGDHKMLLYNSISNITDCSHIVCPLFSAVLTIPLITALNPETSPPFANIATFLTIFIISFF